jgi:hypothetical protein
MRAAANDGWCHQAANKLDQHQVQHASLQLGGGVVETVSSQEV